MAHDPAGPAPGPGYRPSGPGERQALITDLVIGRGSVGAQELAEAFGVSLMTVHRDLDELQRQGVLRKSRGVATAQPTGVFESNVAYRAKTNVEAKQQIGARACRYLEPGMSVLLDDSTTVAQMLPHLGVLAPLTVATNFLHGLVELTRVPGIDVVALSGHYDAQHDSFLGAACVESLHAMRFDAAFVSTSAAREGYAFHQEDHIVAVKREMLAVATRSYLLIDHTKLARTALHRLAPLSGFAAVVIDAGVGEEQVAELVRLGVQVDVADAG